ncbi:MAG: respiratory nitrate reductase subunit gamma, partial [Paramuribaculum sp.]|nr:respiratory nitrate reductase subunit gamma [Paramuribaculum sp.]
MITTAINSTFWNTLFLCYLPYMAIAVMVVGAIARYRYLGKTIQATSTQFID